MFTIQTNMNIKSFDAKNFKVPNLEQFLENLVP